MFAFLCATGRWVHAACSAVAMKTHKPFKGPPITWRCPACTPTKAPQPPTTTSSPQQKSSQPHPHLPSSPSLPIPPTVSNSGSSRRPKGRWGGGGGGGGGGVPPAQAGIVVYAQRKPAIRPLSSAQLVTDCWVHEACSGAW